MKTLTMPKGSPDPLPELAAFLVPFAPLIRRSSSRRSMERYMTGLLTDLPRKNCEAHGRSWTGPEGWLLGERPLPGEEGEPRWFFSSLPADIPLARLVALAHLHWPIEQFYEDAKGECGLDHFQGRAWEGLHRHVALVMLAYTFLMLQSLEHESSTEPASVSAFPPSAAAQPSRLPPPGPRLMVDRIPASHSVPSSANLTE